MTLIRDWFFRIYGDVAHDKLFCTVMAVIALLVCWLTAEGVVSVGRKTEAWARRRWNRSAKRAARDRTPLPVVDDTAPVAGERYPEQLPAAAAGLRNTRSARRLLWAQIEASLAESARKDVP